MAQHDYVIANGTGAAVRSDLNAGFAAIVSQNSGATAPSTTYAYQSWADTSAGVMKMRNGANNAWITLYQLDGEWSTIAFENGTAAAPSIYFKDSGTDTGIYSPGADQVGISTGGTVRLTTTTTGITSALPVDVPLGAVGTPSITFTGDLNTGIYSPGADQVAISTSGTEKLIVKSDGKVGIGTSSPGAQLQVNTGSAATIGQIIQLASSQTADVLKVVRSDTNNSLQFTPSGQLSFGDISSAPSTVITLGPSTSTNANIKVTANNTGNPNLLLQSMNGGGGGAGAQTSFVYFGDNNRALSYIGGTKTNSFASNASSDLVFGTTPDISATAVTERVRLDSSGRLLVGGSTDSGGALLQVFGDRIRIGTAKTPASASATGTAGEICWDASYIYVCTATNTWKRTAIATW